MKYLFLLLTFGCAPIKPAPVSYFERCNHPETGGLSIPFRGPFENHQFRPDCAPDTLYVWLTNEKIDWVSFPTNPLRNGTYLYAWRTPIATYAYGDVQIRLKLKTGVKFKWMLKGEGQPLIRCPLTGQEDTVFVLTTTYSKTVSEYLICSKDVLESWSTGTPEAFNEAKRELKFLKVVKDEEPLRYDAFGFLFGRKKWKDKNRQFSSDSYFINWDFRDITWSDERLENTIELMPTLDTPYRGQIFGDREHHFKTKVQAFY